MSFRHNMVLAASLLFPQPESEGATPGIHTEISSRQNNTAAQLEHTLRTTPSDRPFVLDIPKDDPQLLSIQRDLEAMIAHVEAPTFAERQRGWHALQQMTHQLSTPESADHLRMALQELLTKKQQPEVRRCLMELLQSLRRSEFSKRCDKNELAAAVIKGDKDAQAFCRIHEDPTIIRSLQKFDPAFTTFRGVPFEPLLPVVSASISAEVNAMTVEERRQCAFDYISSMENGALLRFLFNHHDALKKEIGLRMGALSNACMPRDVLEAVMTDPHSSNLEHTAALGNASMPQPMIDRFTESTDPLLRSIAVSNPGISPNLLKQILTDPDSPDDLLASAVNNPSATSDALAYVLSRSDISESIRMGALMHPHCPLHFVISAIENPLELPHIRFQLTMLERVAPLHEVLVRSLHTSFDVKCAIVRMGQLPVETALSILRDSTLSAEARASAAVHPEIDPALLAAMLKDNTTPLPIRVEIAGREDCTPKDLEDMLLDPLAPIEIRCAAARNTQTPANTLDVVLGTSGTTLAPVREAAVANINAPLPAVHRILADERESLPIRMAATMREGLEPDVLGTVFSNRTTPKTLREAVARHPNMPGKPLGDALLQPNEDPDIRTIAASSENTNSQALADMLTHCTKDMELCLAVASNRVLERDICMALLRKKGTPIELCHMLVQNMNITPEDFMAFIYDASIPEQIRSFCITRITDGNAVNAIVLDSKLPLAVRKEAVSHHLVESKTISFILSSPTPDELRVIAYSSDKAAPADVAFILRNPKAPIPLRAAAAGNPLTPSNALQWAVGTSLVPLPVRVAAIGNPNIPLVTLMAVLSDSACPPEMFQAALAHPDCPRSELKRLFPQTAPDSEERRAILQHPNVGPIILANVIDTGASEQELLIATNNPACPVTALIKLMEDPCTEESIQIGIATSRRLPVAAVVKAVTNSLLSESVRCAAVTDDRIPRPVLGNTLCNNETPTGLCLQILESARTPRSAIEHKCENPDTEPIVREKAQQLLQERHTMAL